MKKPTKKRSRKAAQPQPMKPERRWQIYWPGGHVSVYETKGDAEYWAGKNRTLRPVLVLDVSEAGVEELYKTARLAWDSLCRNARNRRPAWEVIIDAILAGEDQP